MNLQPPNPAGAKALGTPFFQKQAQDGQARAGRLELNHGSVLTPIFMPVGTYGAVKGVPPAMLENLGAQIILGN
ncbi:MAG: tRNA-guanine transglycosylase, partial [Burkholderiaceae bacterium]